MKEIGGFDNLRQWVSEILVSYDQNQYGYDTYDSFIDAVAKRLKKCNYWHEVTEKRVQDAIKRCDKAT